MVDDNKKGNDWHDHDAHVENEKLSDEAWAEFGKNSASATKVPADSASATKVPDDKVAVESVKIPAEQPVKIWTKEEGIARGPLQVVAEDGNHLPVEELEKGHDEDLKKYYKTGPNKGAREV